MDRSISRTPPVMGTAVSKTPSTAPMGSRDLREFGVLDPSSSRRSIKPNKGDGAPFKLEPLAWDGRHLDAIARSNFPRGGSYTAVHVGGEASAWTLHSTRGKSGNPETRGSGGRTRGKSEKSASSPKGGKSASYHKGMGV